VSNRLVSLNGFPVASYLLDCSVNFVQYSPYTTALQLLFTGLDVPLPLLAYCVARVLSASPVPVPSTWYYLPVFLLHVHCTPHFASPERPGARRGS
jgi:hypothetical protein